MYKWWDHKSRFNTFHHFPTEKNPFVLERKCSFFRFRRSRPSLAISLYLSLTLKPHQRLRSFAFKANKRGCRWLGENIPVFTFLVSHRCCGFAWICYWIDLRRPFPADSWRKSFTTDFLTLKGVGEREKDLVCFAAQCFFLTLCTAGSFVHDEGEKVYREENLPKWLFRLLVQIALKLAVFWFSLQHYQNWFSSRFTEKFTRKRDLAVFIIKIYYVW